MSRVPSTSAKVISSGLTLCAAVLTAASAQALPHFGPHRHPAELNDSRVRMVIYNSAELFRDVRIDGHLYTVEPHRLLAVNAPEGTPVYTESTGSLHHKGDLLFAVTREMRDRTIPIK